MNPKPRRLSPLRDAALGLLLLLPLPAAAATMIAEPTALLLGLNKITARASKFLAPVGKPVQFGRLEILVRTCQKNPPEERPESAAFLQIYKLRPGKPKLQEFSGWMFSSSPALSALEDPVYDVNILDCKAASAASPGSSAPPGNDKGNSAR